MIRFARATASALLTATAELAERGAQAVAPVGYDPSDARLIQPPKNPRWVIVANSPRRQPTVRVVGRYRSKWVARWIAGRLPKIRAEHGATYHVERANHSNSPSPT